MAPWSDRRARACAMIRGLQPDVLGLQEVSTRQLEHLREDLPDYEVIAGNAGGATRLPRWAGGLDPLLWGVLGEFHEIGEFCPLLVKRVGVETLEHGSFILGSHLGTRRSPTPHVVTWARVRAVGADTQPVIYNPHLGVLAGLGTSNGRSLEGAD